MTQVNIESVRNIVEVQPGSASVIVAQNTVVVTAGAQQGPRGPTGNVEGVIGAYTVTAGDGLSGGGAITSNVTVEVDSSVVRSSGQQTVGSILYVDEANSRVGINQSAPKASLQVEDRGLETSTLSTSDTTADQVADSFSAAHFRTAKYLIQVHDTVNNYYHSSEVLLTHDGSTTYLTEYAIVFSNVSLASFNADINGGNVRLLVTPTNATNTIKISRDTITV